MSNRKYWGTWAKTNKKNITNDWGMGLLIWTLIILAFLSVAIFRSTYNRTGEESGYDQETN